MERELEEARERLRSLQDSLDQDTSKTGPLHALSTLSFHSFGFSISYLTSSITSSPFPHLLSDPLVVAVRQKLDPQYDSELRRAKSCMAAEVKELTALLQEQGEDRLQQAQDR